jgi:hypothetical protein
LWNVKIIGGDSPLGFKVNSSSDINCRHCCAVDSLVEQQHERVAGAAAVHFSAPTAAALAADRGFNQDEVQIT